MYPKFSITTMNELLIKMRGICHHSIRFNISGTQTNKIDNPTTNARLFPILLTQWKIHNILDMFRRGYFLRPNSIVGPIESSFSDLPTTSGVQVLNISINRYGIQSSECLGNFDLQKNKFVRIIHCGYTNMSKQPRIWH